MSSTSSVPPDILDSIDLLRLSSEPPLFLDEEVEETNEDLEEFEDDAHANLPSEDEDDNESRPHCDS